jgi:hypothetical protein
MPQDTLLFGYWLTTAKKGLPAATAAAILYTVKSQDTLKNVFDIRENMCASRNNITFLS